MIVSAFLLFLGGICVSGDSAYNSEEAETLVKTMRNSIANVPPVVLALAVGFIILVLVTIFPELKDTLVEIAKALRGM